MKRIRFLSVAAQRPKDDAVTHPKREAPSTADGSAIVTIFAGILLTAKIGQMELVNRSQKEAT